MTALRRVPPDGADWTIGTEPTAGGGAMRTFRRPAIEQADG